MQTGMDRDAQVMLVRAGEEGLARVRALLVEAQLACEIVCEPGDCGQAPLCRWLDPSQLNAPGQAQAALTDAVEVLERSRHAFKSRELGSLRRRLENVLKELSADD